MTGGFAPAEFAGALGAADRAALTAAGRRRRIPAGGVLFVEGTRSDVVMVVLAGRVKVVTAAEDGTETVLAVRGPGALLGELAAIDDAPRSATVVALEPVEVLAVGLREFCAFLHAHPDAMWVLLRLVTARLRDADRKRAEFGGLDTLSRVAVRLLELAERFGEPVADGVRITVPLSQEELGSWVGASREAVAKALGTLRARGALTTSRRAVTVRDPDLLRRFADR